MVTLRVLCLLWGGAFCQSAFALGGDLTSDIITTFTNLVGTTGVVILGTLGVVLLRTGFSMVWRIIAGYAVFRLFRGKDDKGD